MKFDCTCMVEIDEDGKVIVHHEAWCRYAAPIEPSADKDFLKTCGIEPGADEGGKEKA